MNPFLYFVDSLSAWVGKAFGWCIMVLTFATCYEVFVRYALNAPTVWAFDMSRYCISRVSVYTSAFILILCLFRCETAIKMNNLTGDVIRGRRSQKHR